MLAPAKTVDGIFDALRSLSAYATSGQRIILDAELNGSPMGSRQELERHAHYHLPGHGHCTYRIRSMSSRTARWCSGRSTRTRRLNPIRVWCSVSSPLPGYSARPATTRGRTGCGRAPFVSTEHGSSRSIPSASTTSISTAIDRDPADPGLIRFRVETRGRWDRHPARAGRCASEATSLSFTLEPTTEYGFAPPIVRKPAQLPGDDFRVRLADVAGDGWERRFAVGEHTDRITLRITSPAGMMDRDFEFTDVENPQPGDYYYVRVTQLDGGRAWSSPFWVGQKQE